MKAHKPTREELHDAVNRTVEDLIDHDLKVLFCGINPGLYSAATGLHFARPGNRFWRALRDGGLTPSVFQPWQQRDLLACGLGITNFVARATATAAELDDDELRAGLPNLARKLRRYRPRI